MKNHQKWKSILLECGFSLSYDGAYMEYHKGDPNGIYYSMTIFPPEDMKSLRDMQLKTVCRCHTIKQIIVGTTEDFRSEYTVYVPFDRITDHLKKNDFSDVGEYTGNNDIAREHI